MNAMKNKIRSRRGASITFALLLFLVCAVISSVVIVAASTAGGRLSTLKEMDQRYFAATAAADVLRTRLDGQSATVTYQKDADGKVTAVSTTTGGILGSVSTALVRNPSTGTLSEPLLASKTRTVEDTQYSYGITGSLDRGMLTCEIRVTGGRIKSDGTYVIQMIFASTIKESDIDATNGRAKVTWKMSSVKKHRAD